MELKLSASVLVFICEKRIATILKLSNLIWLRNSLNRIDIIGEYNYITISFYQRKKRTTDGHIDL